MTQPNPQPRRRGRKWWVFGVLAAAIAIQSVTITPGARLQYVSAHSGDPIEGLPVVVVWRLRSGNLGGSLDADVIRVVETHTDAQGKVRFGAAVMLHVPVFPFSPLYRDIRYLPVVYAADERYEANVAASGLRFRPDAESTSFLSYRRAALDGEVLKLEPSRNAHADHRDKVLQEIQQAHFSCRHVRFCREVER